MSFTTRGRANDLLHDPPVLSKKTKTKTRKGLVPPPPTETLKKPTKKIKNKIASTSGTEPSISKTKKSGVKVKTSTVVSTKKAEKKVLKTPLMEGLEEHMRMASRSVKTLIDSRFACFIGDVLFARDRSGEPMHEAKAYAVKLEETGENVDCREEGHEKFWYIKSLSKEGMAYSHFFKYVHDDHDTVTMADLAFMNEAHEWLHSKESETKRFKKFQSIYKKFVLQNSIDTSARIHRTFAGLLKEDYSKVTKVIKKSKQTKTKIKE